MLFMWMSIACNTPETVEVPTIPEVEEQAPNKAPSNDASAPTTAQTTGQSKSKSAARTTPYFSEVMQIPLKVAKFRGEWIELYNPTDAIIDLSTYSVHSKDDTGISFTTEHTIQPKSTFLMAVRKSATGNGGLPKVDFLYNHDVLKIAATDWIELRKGTDVIDRWEISRDEVKKGYSLQRSESGSLCHASETYGDGDYGSPKTLSACP